MAYGSEKTYKNTFDLIFTVAQKAVCDCGYKIDSIDKANGLITFKTDRSMRSWYGLEMSIMILGISDGNVEVTVAGWRIPSFQLFDWLEVRRIAKRVLSEMDEYL